MKIISFYLPQFHTFPENDQWWGKGFTEWTNTKKAKVNFKNQYQPHVPLNDNYYDLVLDESIMKNQIILAKRYGIDAFCYYHYWFSPKKKLMEKPIERMLADKDLDMPFCLCWANENWSRRWDGSENQILIGQEYGDKKDWIDHFFYLNDFFNDLRYLKDENERPIFIIYKPQLIDNLSELLSFWDNLAKKSGFPGLCFVCQYPQSDKKIISEFDFLIDFEPIQTSEFVREKFLKSLLYSPKFSLEVLMAKFLNLLNLRTYKKLNYEDAVKASINRKVKKNTWLGVFPGWDNTARRGQNSIVYYNSTPEIFEKYVIAQLDKAKKVNKESFLFVNAWNEWAEGAHLEPDERFGYKYLEAISKARDARN